VGDLLFSGCSHFLEGFVHVFIVFFDEFLDNVVFETQFSLEVLVFFKFCIAFFTFVDEIVRTHFDGVLEGLCDGLLNGLLLFFEVEQEFTCLRVCNERSCGGGDLVDPVDVLLQFVEFMHKQSYFRTLLVLQTFNH